MAVGTRRVYILSLWTVGRVSSSSADERLGDGTVQPSRERMGTTYKLPVLMPIVSIG